MTDVVTTTSVDEQVATVTQVVTDVVEIAHALEVSTGEQAVTATELLARIAKARKDSEAARTFLVKPLNDHVKAINQRFKESTAPLEEADELVRGKVVAFREQEERERQAEQARLEAERRDAERAAEEERQRLAAEARAAAEQLAAAKAEREGELAQQAAALNDDALAAIAFGEGDEELRKAAAQEIRRRRDEQEARDAAEAARNAEEAARVRELQSKAAVAPVAAAPVALKSASGSAAQTRRWKGTVTDEQLVPREYLIVDQRLINKAVRDGVREIPGVRIEQETGLSVRAAR